MVKRNKGPDHIREHVENEYCHEVKKNLVMNHVLFDEECKGSMPDCEEIARDNQASEALEAVSLYIATLNVTGSLVEQILNVHDEVNKLKTFGFMNKQLLLNADYVMHEIVYSPIALFDMDRAWNSELSSKSFLMQREF